MSIIRRLAIRHGDRLGLANRMRLAKAFNLITKGKLNKRRTEAYRQAVLRGELANTGIKIRDGWAVDLSRSFPFLQELLSDADRLLEKARGPAKTSKRFMGNLLREDDALPRSLLDFATSPQLVAPIAEYLGLIPVLSSVKLLESHPTSVTEYGSSQCFHLDHADCPLVKVNIHLTDIDAESGPMSFLPAAASRAGRTALRYGSFGAPYRVSDRDMQQALGEEYKPVSATFDRGAVFFIDTSNCFHLGSRNSSRVRRLIQLQYVSACRTDFREADRYAKYAAGSDSWLGKMVLDVGYQNTGESSA